MQSICSVKMHFKYNVCILCASGVWCLVANKSKNMQIITNIVAESKLRTRIWHGFHFMHDITNSLHTEELCFLCVSVLFIQLMNAYVCDFVFELDSLLFLMLQKGHTPSSEWVIRSAKTILSHSIQFIEIICMRLHPLNVFVCVCGIEKLIKLKKSIRMISNESHWFKLLQKKAVIYAF